MVDRLSADIHFHSPPLPLLSLLLLRVSNCFGFAGAFVSMPGEKRFAALNKKTIDKFSKQIASGSVAPMLLLLLLLLPLLLLLSLSRVLLLWKRQQHCGMPQLRLWCFGAIYQRILLSVFVAVVRIAVAVVAAVPAVGIAFLIVAAWCWP